MKQHTYKKNTAAEFQADVTILTVSFLMPYTIIALLTVVFRERRIHTGEAPTRERSGCIPLLSCYHCDGSFPMSYTINAFINSSINSSYSGRCIPGRSTLTRTALHSHWFEYINSSICKLVFLLPG